MISSSGYRKVRINITTYRPNGSVEEMNDKCMKNPVKMCAMCLETKNEINELEKKPSKACPLCQKCCGYCKNNKKERDRLNTKERVSSKGVQTTETDIAQGLTLLNEVLTVFQNKKGDFKEKSKTGLYRDVGVSTDNNYRSKLCVNTFQYSIDEGKKTGNGKFSVINSSQPIYFKKSVYSIDLINHKSSSIPQMKLEELKYSLKEKTKSKDAIEEVNRMFATVRKNTSMECSNRPVVRNGPRVLPVVKNNVPQPIEGDLDKYCAETCKCCQTNQCMSSGDSLVNYNKVDEEKCLYMVCCHYKNHRKSHTGAMICERCRQDNDCHCIHENFNDDSC